MRKFFGLVVFTSFLFTLGLVVVKSFAANGKGAPTTSGDTGTGGGGGSDGGTTTCSAGTMTGVTGMLMQRNDLARTGRNMNETALNPTTVQGDFGLIGRLPVDGQVYAQPVVANNVQILTGGTGSSLGTSDNAVSSRNIVYVATENDSVYAFDVTDQSSFSTVVNQYQPLWHVSFIDQACSSTGTSSTGTACAVNAAARQERVKPGRLARAQALALVRGQDATTVTPVQVNAPNISPTIGITATPVIDPTTQTIYVTAMTDEGGTIHWRLHALDMATGAERGTPADMSTATYPGSGYKYNGVTDSNGNVITFSAINQLSRAGLVLNNGYVTVAFTSFDDNEPDHGWVFNYRAYLPCDAANSLKLAAVYVTTPNSGDGSIWQSGMGPAVDTDGTMFFATGNGDPIYASMTPADYADSVLRLKMASPNYNNPSSGYSLVDFFTPYNHVALATGDVDLGSGGVLLLPQSETGSQIPLMVAGGKQGTVYLLNRQNLGKISSSTTEDTNIPQELVGDIPGGKNYGPGIYGAPAYYNNSIYIGAAGDYLRSIPLTNSGCALASGMGNTCLSWADMQKSSVAIPLRGASPVISANGPTDPNAIVWYIDASAYQYSWTVGQIPPVKTDGSAILYAFLASNLSTPLYKSTPTSVSNLAATQNQDNCIGLDNTNQAAGCAVKFAVPTVQNGMVFVGTDTEVSVYGLISH